MTKIKKIEVKNFKAISEMVANFDGCSAVVTSGNNKGKTSFLKGLIDRFRSQKPQLIVKEGEKKGYQVMELTDGSRIIWNFTENSERFSFVTKDGFEKKTGVLEAIGSRYFGVQFDIDKFLNSGPKKQSEELQRIVGLDFSQLDSDYAKAYENRTYANRKWREVSARKLEQPETPNIPFLPDEIKSKIEDIEQINEAKRKKWLKDNEKHLSDVQKFNSDQEKIQSVKDDANRQLHYFGNLPKEYKNFVDMVGFKKFFDSLPEPQASKPYKNLPEPEYESISALKEDLEKAQKEVLAFESKKNEYEKWIKEGQKARKSKEKADQLVDEIMQEKKIIIESAEMPEGFEFAETGILFNGFPLDSNQLSSSQKYIAGLKLGAMVLGEIKALHFDASFLDKNSLKDVQEWAEKNDLQLLIERPDYEGGEIEFKVI